MSEAGIKQKQKLTGPCYDGKQHRWKTLTKTSTRKLVKWCEKCGEEKEDE